MGRAFGSMESALDDGLPITMFVECFGARVDSYYCGAISAPFTKDTLTCNQVSSRLLYEHESGMSS